MGDIRRKLPWYRSDFTDALHIQVVFPQKETLIERICQLNERVSNNYFFLSVN